MFELKNRTCHYFDGIIKLKDVDIDILKDEKSTRKCFDLWHFI